MIDYLYIPTALLRDFGFGKASMIAYFWASISGKMVNGQDPVCWNTNEEMADVFGVSVRSVKAYIKELENEEIIVSDQLLGFDRTKHYRLSDDVIGYFRPQKSGKNCTMHSAKSAPSIVQNLHHLYKEANTHYYSSNILGESENSQAPQGEQKTKENQPNQKPPSEKKKNADTPPSSARPPQKKWSASKTSDENTKNAPKEWVGHNSPTEQEIYNFMAIKTNDNELAKFQSKAFRKYYDTPNPSTLAVWCQTDGGYIRSWESAAIRWLARNLSNQNKNATRKTGLADIISSRYS